MTLLNRNPGYVAHWREAMCKYRHLSAVNYAALLVSKLSLLLIRASVETADPKPCMWRPMQIYVGKLPPQKQDDDVEQNPVALSSL